MVRWLNLTLCVFHHWGFPGGSVADYGLLVWGGPDSVPGQGAGSHMLQLSSRGTTKDAEEPNKYLRILCMYN